MSHQEPQDHITRTALETHGRLDVLVNNAGVVRTASLGSYTREVIGLQLATNLVARPGVTMAVPQTRTGSSFQPSVAA